MDTKQTDGMNTTEIRRARLKQWFERRAIPEDEKSYLSQLKNGRASFGEKAARRLEKTYGMPAKYLDTPLDLEAQESPEHGDMFEAWRDMPPKRRALIESVLLSDISDAQAEALQGVINAYTAAEKQPKRPASAVTGGPPRRQEAAKKTRLMGTKK